MEHLRRLTGNQMKIIGLVAMTCDHVGLQLFPDVMFLRILGRLAFPIFAFQAAQGYHHTHDFKGYCKRLALFALVSEIPFNLAMGSSWSYPIHQNVLWSFLIALALIHLNERDKATAIAEVVYQSSLKSDEMGIYWRDNNYGWSWDSNPIATQAMLIEAFTELRQPSDIIGRMQQWLLKQKQTTEWSNSIATTQAVYALMETSPHPLPKRGLADCAKETATEKLIRIAAKYSNQSEMTGSSPSGGVEGAPPICASSQLREMMACALSSSTDEVPLISEAMTLVR